MLTPLTAFYAGLLGLFYMLLSARIPLARRQFRVGIGDGGNKELAKLIRVHGNFSEYIPIALILMLISELNKAPLMLLNIAGVLLVTGRLLHAFGLSRRSGSSFGRFTGTGMTWASIIILSAWLLSIFILGA